MSNSNNWGKVSVTWETENDIPEDEMTKAVDEIAMAVGDLHQPGTYTFTVVVTE